MFQGLGEGMDGRARRLRKEMDGARRQGRHLNRAWTGMMEQSSGETVSVLLIQETTSFSIPNVTTFMIVDFHVIIQA